MLFAVKKIVFGFLNSAKETTNNDEILVSISILVEIILAFLLMIGISIYGARQHNKIHDKI